MELARAAAKIEVVLLDKVPANLILGDLRMLAVVGGGLVARRRDIGVLRTEGIRRGHRGTGRVVLRLRGEVRLDATRVVASMRVIMTVHGHRCVLSGHLRYFGIWCLIRGTELFWCWGRLGMGRM